MIKEYSEEINGIKFNYCIEEVLSSQMRPILNALSGIPKEKIVDGFRIGVGFSIYTLTGNNNEFDIIVSDYTKSPFVDTTKDLSLAIWIQYEQALFLREHNIEGRAIRFDDVIAVAKEALDKESISMPRFSDLGGSGWCINEVRIDENKKFSIRDTDEYETIYAYQLLHFRPQLMNTLLLPYDYIVVCNGDEVVEVLNDKDESIIGNQS